MTGDGSVLMCKEPVEVESFAKEKAIREHEEFTLLIRKSGFSRSIHGPSIPFLLTLKNGAIRQFMANYPEAYRLFKAAMTELLICSGATVSQIKKAQVYSDDRGLSEALSPAVDRTIRAAVRLYRVNEVDPGDHKSVDMIIAAVETTVIHTLIQFCCQVIAILRCLYVTYDPVGQIDVVAEVCKGDKTEIKLNKTSAGWSSPFMVTPNEIEAQKNEVRRVTSEKVEQASQLHTALENLSIQCDQIDQLEDQIEMMRARIRDQDVLMDDLRRELRPHQVAPVACSDKPGREHPPFGSWDEIFNWCDLRLQGRIVILPKARKEAKSSPFEDLESAAAALDILGNEFWENAILSGDEDSRKNLHERLIQNGFRVSGVGQALKSSRFKDQYFCMIDGKREVMDMHMAGSSNKDRKRCLRVYFTWKNDVIYVGHLPTHLGSWDGVSL